MKASDFAIGLKDFFAILIPGSVLLLLLGLAFLTPRNIGPVGAGLFGFTVASYLIGSVAAAVGSLLDWPVDDFFESHWLGLFDRRRSAKHSLAKRIEVAEALRAKLLRADPEDQRLLGEEKLKSFWWDVLRLNSPAAIAELDRLEANQKLFRSLVGTFVLLILLVTAARCSVIPVDVSHLNRWWLAVAALGSFFFYAAGRFRFLHTLYRLAAAHSVRCSSG